MQNNLTNPPLVRGLVFSPIYIAELESSRGSAWGNFIKSTTLLYQNSLAQVAFLLMISRMANCAKCNMNSFRSSLGCFQCASQTLKRFRGPDEELLNLFLVSKLEVHEFVLKGKSLVD